MTTTKNYPSIKQSWGIIGLIILFSLVSIPLLGILSHQLSKDQSLFISYFIIMGIPLVLLYFIRRKKTGRSSFNFELGSLNLIGLVLITIIGIQTGISGPVIHLIPMPDSFKKIFLEFSNQRGVLSIITMVVLAPIFEELIFRGIILDGLLRRYSPQKSIVLTSVLFGIVHLNPWQFVSAFVFGIFAGWVYYNTQKISLTILMHFWNNLIAFSQVYVFDPEEMLQDSLPKLYGGYLNFSLIIGAALLISIFGIYILNKGFNNLPNYQWIQSSDPSDENTEAMELGEEIEQNIDLTANVLSDEKES